MMRKLLSLLIAAVLLCAGACAEAENTMEITFEANPSTGYSWTGFVVSGDSVELDSAEGSFVSSDETGMMDGAGGSTTYTLTAVKPGLSVVLFTYQRSWENDIDQRRVILVIVDDAMNITANDITEYGLYTGTVVNVNVDSAAVTLQVTVGGKIIAEFAPGLELPAMGEMIQIYTDGIVAKCIPPVVHALAWNAVPSELARIDENADQSNESIESFESFGSLEPFEKMTGFADFLQSVTENNPVVSVYFTEGYGQTEAEFTTTDPDEIRAMVEAMTQVQIASASDLMITDWYPLLCFTCEDGTEWSIAFDGRWLVDSNGNNYNLNGDEDLWSLVEQLMKKYENNGEN